MRMIRRYFGTLRATTATFWYREELADVRELLRGLLVERFAEPLLRVRAWLYLILAVVGLGGIGTWLTVFMFERKREDVGSLLLSVITYVVAIIVTSLLDLMLDEDRATTGSIRLTMALASALACIPIGQAVLVFYADGAAPTTPLKDMWRWMVPCWIIWWLANAKDSKFAHRSRLDAAAGGDPTRELP
jgi:heme A synthase